ncbi:hypothetical protein RHMOL_Rhmol10G0158500 [Rhododendron molle]|uniref:Uncharacterized protein n=1 Tax=Rhododendron molle TaxID=49168 RepID=A0ACC0M2Z0_RHOML|nr:hypothetical protein RHMOL_Rhmol10G0158500 [Rhododendron molle]
MLHFLLSQALVFSLALSSPADTTHGCALRHALSGVSMIYGGVGLVKVNGMSVAAAGGLYLLVRVRFRVFLG